MNNPSALLLVGALLSSIVFMFIAFQTLAGTHFFCALSAPLVTVANPPGQEPSFDWRHQKYRGFFSLSAIYFFTAFAIAFTSGHIGVFHFHRPAVETLYWGFSVGIMVVALARFDSVFFSTSFAKHLELLVVFFGGVLIYLLITKRESFQNHPFQDAGQSFILFAVLSVGCVASVVEFCIWAAHRLPRPIRIPFSLLKERMEAFAMVEQEFVGSKVEKYTDRRLEEIVLKEGLTHFEWITQTPPPHLPNLEPILQLTLTRRQIQGILCKSGLLWYPLYRDRYGIVYIRPGDVSILMSVLEKKGLLDASSRITAECSPPDLDAILTENKIQRHVANDGLGEMGLRQATWMSATVAALQAAGCVVEMDEREKAPNVSKCPWLSKLADRLRDEGLVLKLVPLIQVRDQIQRVTKVIVASDQPTPALKDYKLQKQHIEIPTRVRYMVINSRHVIVHLPVPFTGRAGEQSNCVHWSDQPAIVAIFWDKFRSLWDCLSFRRGDHY
jgi:hypothetical protein